MHAELLHILFDLKKKEISILIFTEKLKFLIFKWISDKRDIKKNLGWWWDIGEEKSKCMDSIQTHEKKKNGKWKCLMCFKDTTGVRTQMMIFFCRMNGSSMNWFKL